MFGFTKERKKAEEYIDSDEEPPSFKSMDYKDGFVLEDESNSDNKADNGVPGYLKNKSDSTHRSVSFVEEDDEDINFIATYSGDVFVTEANRGKPVYESDSDYRLD